MKKNIFSFEIKKINYDNLFLFFFIIYSLISQIKSYFYFQVNSLLSGNLLLITDSHILLQNKSTSEYTYLIDVINPKNDDNFLNFVSFSQFPSEDEGYIICRFKNSIHVISKNEIDDLKNINNTNIGEYYSKIIAYEIKDNILSFILAYVNSDNILNLILYNLDLILYTYNFSEYKSDKIFIQDVISCELMYRPEISDTILICFLSELSTNNLVIYSFNPKENFKNEFLKRNNNINKIEVIKSETSKDRTKSLICYINFLNSIYNYNCLVYDSYNNILSEEITLVKNCDKYSYETNINYINKNSEYYAYIFSENKKFHLFKFDENFNLKNEDNEGDKCYKLKEIDNCDKKLCSSLYYDEDNNYYNLKVLCRLQDSNITSTITIENECNTKINISNFIEENSITETSLSLTHFIEETYLSSTNLSIIKEIKFYNENGIIKGQLNRKKEELEENLDEIMSLIEIGNKYKIKGDDYNITISPINNHDSFKSAYVDISICERILRKEYHINSSEILTILQIEINKMNENSLTNKIEYAIYNENKEDLNLSFCKDVKITINYKIKDKLKLNISMISYFSDMGIDIFDNKDNFFNDICYPYSNSVSDIILKDRISDIYQNFSLCDNNCEYGKFDLDSMSVTCSCDLKTEINTQVEPPVFGKIVEDAFKNSNFGVIKCYKLVFSLKYKKENIGFWLFLILVISQIPLFLIYFKYKLKYIKLFVFKEMIKNNYIAKMETPPKKSLDNINVKNNEKKSSNGSILKYNIKNVIIKLDNNNSPFIINNINNKIKNNSLISKGIYNSNSVLIGKNQNPINIYLKNLIKKKVDHISDSNQSQDFLNNKFAKKKLTSYISINNEKGNFPGYYNLIQINANNSINNIPPNSKFILDNYDYENAIRYDKRNFSRIFYICLLSKENILNTFFFKAPLESQPLRISIFIFSYSCDFALNGLFYLNQNISDKYHYKGDNLYFFTIVNNLTISISSSLFSFILIKSLEILINVKDDIEGLFRQEEIKMRKNKEFKVDNNTKKIIHLKLVKIFKILKKKILVYIIIELILIIFFFYYITAFCEVYKDTQISWLADCFVSFLLSILTELFFSFIIAILYIIAIKFELKILYKIIIFFYGFG